jgi:hypothetical protein
MIVFDRLALCISLSDELTGAPVPFFDLAQSSDANCPPDLL